MEPKNEKFSLEDFVENLKNETNKRCMKLPQNTFLQIIGINYDNETVKLTLSNGTSKFTRFYVDKDKKEILNKIKNKDLHMVEIKQIMISKLNYKSIVYITQIGQVIKSQDKITGKLNDLSKSESASIRNSVTSNKFLQSNKKIEQHGEKSNITPAKTSNIEISLYYPSTPSLDEILLNFKEEDNPSEFSDKKIKEESIKKEIISPITNKQNESYESFQNSFNRKNNILNNSCKSSVENTIKKELEGNDNSNNLESDINENLDKNSKNRLSSNNKEEFKKSEKKENLDLDIIDNSGNVDEFNSNIPKSKFITFESKKRSSVSNNPLISAPKTSVINDEGEKSKKSKKNPELNNIQNVQNLNNIQSPILQQVDKSVNKSKDKEDNRNNIKKENKEIEEIVDFIKNNEKNFGYNNIEEANPKEIDGDNDSKRNSYYNRFFDGSLLNKGSIKNEIVKYSNLLNNIENNKNDAIIKDFHELKMAPLHSKLKIKFRIISFSYNKYNTLFYSCVDQQNNCIDFKIRIEKQEYLKQLRLNGVFELNSTKEPSKQEIFKVIYNNNNKNDTKPMIELHGFEHLVEIDEDDREMPQNIFHNIKRITEIDYLYRNLISKVNVVVFAVKKVMSNSKYMVTDLSKQQLNLEIDPFNKNRVTIECGKWHLLTNVIIYHSQDKGYYLKTFYETNCMEINRSNSYFKSQYQLNMNNIRLDDYNSKVKFVPADNVVYHFINDIYKFVSYSLDNNRNPKENVYKKEILKIDKECDSVFIRGTIFDFENNINHVYKGCSRCRKEPANSHLIDKFFNCVFCNLDDNSTLKNYYVIKFFVKDELGDLICLTMFDETAPTLMKDYDCQRYYELVKKALESIKTLYNNHQDVENYDGRDKLEEIKNNIADKKFTFRIDINYEKAAEYKSFVLLGINPL